MYELAIRPLILIYRAISIQRYKYFMRTIVHCASTTNIYCSFWKKKSIVHHVWLALSSVVLAHKLRFSSTSLVHRHYGVTAFDLIPCKIYPIVHLLILKQIIGKSTGKLQYWISSSVCRQCTVEFKNAF